MITIVGRNPDAWGFIPTFLDEQDPRDARTQIGEKYQGGWLSLRQLPGLEFNRNTATLNYPDDPPFHAIGALYFRDELLVLYPSAFVVILQKDGSWDIARMD